MAEEPQVVPHSCGFCGKKLLELSPYDKLSVDYTYEYALSATQEGCLFFRWWFPEWVQRIGITKSKDKHIHINFRVSSTLWGPTTFYIDNGTRAPFSIDRGIRLQKDASCYTYRDDPMSKYTKLRPINKFPGSEESFELARQWIKLCKEQHRHPQTEQHPLPSRVIDVGSEDDLSVPRLHQNHGLQKSPYLCLSYCWGGEQTVRLTHETVSEWSSETGIPVATLPKTLQDAVTVTKKTGYRYLWIDALCILQDDPFDIEREIIQVPAIFKGASFTIAASRARDCTEGFLQHRPFGPESEDAFSLPVKLDDLLPGTIIISPSVPKGYESGGFVEPADSRGWILQEQMLSPRILEYGTLCTRWTCPLTNQDSSFDVELWDGGGLEMHKVHISIWDDKPHKYSASYPGLTEAGVTWCRIVETFTARSTKLYKDRVYAIAGVAEEFGRHIDGRYLAGIWESTFPAALLWSVEVLPHPRPLERLAPTWSWMSILGPVTYHQWDLIDEKPMAELVTFAIHLNSLSAKYGGTHDSFIVLRGRPQQARWTKGRSRLERYKPALSQRNDPQLDTIAQYTSPDTSDLASTDCDDLEVWFLPVTVREGVIARDDVKIRGLILGQRGLEPSPLSFYREGYFVYDSRDARVEPHELCDGPLRDITIY